MQVLTPEMKRQLLRDKGIVISLDSKVELKLDELAKILRSKTRKSSRKANKQLKSDTTLKSLGNYYLVKTNVGLSPHNTKQGTQYMLPANSVCIAVQMRGWMALYIINNQLFDSIEDVKAKCRYIRANDVESYQDGKYPDFRIIGIPEFRDPAKVAFKKMLPENWSNDAVYSAKVKNFYGM